MTSPSKTMKNKPKVVTKPKSTTKTNASSKSSSSDSKTSSRSSGSNRIHNVILDLDETLISAIEVDLLKKDKSLAEQYKTRNGMFRVHKMDTDYYIVERPGVQDFLDFLFAHFTVSVWTAASKEYALFVVEKVLLQKPERKLDYICHSYHCDLSKEKTGCIKQLNHQFYHFPQYDPKNTIIIDDNNNVLTKQIGGVYPIRPFDFFSKHSERDKALAEMKEKILKRL